MISFTVRMSFRPEDHEQVQDALRALTVASRLEPGCLAYVPHTIEGDPNIVVIYEQFRDQAAREAHAASDHFKKYAVGCLYQRMLLRETENLRAVV